MRLLLIDDEVEFVRALQQLLQEQQFLVDMATDGTEGLEVASLGTYDLLIVDVMLPGVNGYEIVKQLRSQGISTPILLLTAKDAVDDRVKGLDSGADDYLVKPFATKELLARVRALTRRTGDIVGTEELTVGNYTLHLLTRTLVYCDMELKLTAKEFQLLELFMRNPNRVLPKVVIFDRVWGFDAELDSNVVEIYIHMLRKKLASICEDEASSVIETVRGVGYVFRGN